MPVDLLVQVNVGEVAAHRRSFARDQFKRQEVPAYDIEIDLDRCEEFLGLGIVREDFEMAMVPAGAHGQGFKLALKSAKSLASGKFIIARPIAPPFWAMLSAL